MKVAPGRMLLIIAGVIRRIHVPLVFEGEIRLDPGQARHARDVLRLEAGEVVEVFDDAGAVAQGELILAGRDVSVRVDVIALRATDTDALEWIIAAAVPKGERSDWMVEKLSELGASAFIPLAAERSVVLPEGRNKRERWTRIATEAAKQSRRIGVMRIGELTPLEEAVAAVSAEKDAVGWHFSTSDDARPVSDISAALPVTRSLTAFIGPEGGWTEAELARFAGANFTPVRLTHTVLRTETAAVAAAAVIGTLVAPGKGPRVVPA